MTLMDNRGWLTAPVADDVRTEPVSIADSAPDHEVSWVDPVTGGARGRWRRGQRRWRRLGHVSRAVGRRSARRRRPEDRTSGTRPR